MAKKVKRIKKKNKLKILPALIFLLGVFLVTIIIKFGLDSPIRNIFIYNNELLTDQEIIDEAGLSNYPSFLKTASFSIKNRLLKNKLIKSVTIRKRVFNRIDIYIEEKKVLFKNKEENLVLDDKTELDNKTITAPHLLNYVPDTIYDRFIKEMSKIKENIKREISEIEYSSTNYDSERFLLYMNDGNYVYLTLTKFDHLNYYNDVYATLGNKKGILYLDSGNHFKIMK